MDVVAAWPGQCGQQLIDVTIRCTYGERYAKLSEAAGIAARAGEREKATRYGCGVAPLSFETLGRLGVESQRTLEVLAQSSREFASHDAGQGPRLIASFDENWMPLAAAGEAEQLAEQHPKEPAKEEGREGDAEAEPSTSSSGRAAPGKLGCFETVGRLSVKSQRTPVLAQSSRGIASNAAGQGRCLDAEDKMQPEASQAASEKVHEHRGDEAAAEKAEEDEQCKREPWAARAPEAVEEDEDDGVFGNGFDAELMRRGATREEAEMRKS